MTKVYVVYDNTYEFIYGVFSNQEKADYALKLSNSSSAVILSMFVDVFEEGFLNKKIYLGGESND